MNDTFGTTTQTLTRNNTEKKNTCVLSLVMSYETRHKNTIELFKVLSCVIHIVVDNYICIDYIGCQSNKLIETCIDRNYLEISFNKNLGIGIPDLLMDVLLCPGFTKNMKYTGIFLCP